MSEKYSELTTKLVDVAKEHAGAVDAKAAFPQAAIDLFLSSGLGGLMSSKDVGGMGLAHRAAAEVVSRVASVCASSGMIITMHFSAVAVLERLGDAATRKAATSKLCTLAFSETGSRSHFWVPIGTAERTSGGVKLNAKKSFTTSASKAEMYVWSSKPLAGEQLNSLWLVPRSTKGISVDGAFEGLGLRGNDSAPITAKDAVVPEKNLLGDDGAGFTYMLESVLPTFNVLAAAVAVGIMDGALAATTAHASGARFEHMNSALRELPTIRNYIARMQCRTDMTRALLFDTIDAMEKGRPDATLRVLESKAVAGESATEVLDVAMRVCGGAAFRRDVGVERLFRDARAGTVMAPTTDQLYDFIGKAVCGMDVF